VTGAQGAKVYEDDGSLKFWQGTSWVQCRQDGPSPRAERNLHLQAHRTLGHEVGLTIGYSPARKLRTPHCCLPGRHSASHHSGFLKPRMVAAGAPR